MSVLFTHHRGIVLLVLLIATLVLAATLFPNRRLHAAFAVSAVWTIASVAYLGSQ